MLISFFTIIPYSRAGFICTSNIFIDVIYFLLKCNFFFAIIKKYFIVKHYLLYLVLIVISQAFIWATMCGSTYISAELEPFTTVIKTSTPNFIAFSLKCRDKRLFFMLTKITQWDFIKSLLLHISKCIDLMFQKMQTAWNRFLMLLGSFLLAPSHSRFYHSSVVMLFRSKTSILCYFLFLYKFSVLYHSKCIGK